MTNAQIEFGLTGAKYQASTYTSCISETLSSLPANELGGQHDNVSEIQSERSGGNTLSCCRQLESLRHRGYRNLTIRRRGRRVDDRGDSNVGIATPLNLNR